MKNIIMILLVAFSIAAYAQELITYEVPHEMLYTAHNDDFTVKVRVPDGEWQDLYEYNVQVDMDRVSDASMVYFDFSGKVDVWVKKNNGLVHKAEIRPRSYNIVPEINGNVMTFSLEQTRNISLEVNGDKLHSLHLFANPIRNDKPDIDDPDVIYFGPGVHRPGDLPGDVFHIPSGKTVYIDGGAVVLGKFMIDSARDVRIIGHGLVYQPERGVEIRHSHNVTVDGPIFINPDHYTIYGGGSTGLNIRNIKSFACKPWTDGIDLMSCSDVVVDGVFLRTSDDCIAIYGHRWDFYGNARNIQIKNSSLWADVAHPTNIGVHGNATAGGDTIENVVFSNIDILEHDEDTRIAQGCFGISAGDNNLVRSIKYENIRIEDFEEGMLLKFQVFYSEKYGHAAGRGIHDIILKDVQYNGNSANPSEIIGYSEDRNVKNILIEGLKINGQVVENATDGNIHIGEFTSDIVFKK
ncbi:MAG: glycosyl hydrolase family 28 protein [Prolixibacteraceae bacterium]|jgi:polygalacturonase|nr:glycosyl hydrolase family 28 protein [Prolixibacteraceae bacterium]